MNKAGRKPIQDSFTDLKVSRQRKYQMRRALEGGCHVCGQPKVTAWFCLGHAVARRENQRKLRGSVERRDCSATYQLEAAARNTQHAHPHVS